MGCVFPHCKYRYGVHTLRSQVHHSERQRRHGDSPALAVALCKYLTRRCMSITSKLVTYVNHPNHEVFVKLPSGKCVSSVCIDRETLCLRQCCPLLPYVCAYAILDVPVYQHELIQVMPPIDWIRHFCFFHRCLTLYK